jgi:5-methylcytosine-specific restriction endonuclease McrA
MSCSIETCDRPAFSRGWCRPHYAKWYNHGNPLYEKPKRARMRFTEEEERSITALYLNGGEDRSKITQIVAEQYGCSQRTIRQIVVRNGGEVRQRRVGKHDPPPSRSTVCTAPGCTGPLRTNALRSGLCREHRVKAYAASAPPCLVPECPNNAAYGRSGLCEMHAKRLKLRGKVGVGMRERVRAYNGALCKHPDRCPRVAKVDGWCELHWERVERTGDPGPVGVIYDGSAKTRVSKRCSVCAEERPAEEFYALKTGYLSSPCRSCARRQALASRHANLDRARATSRRYYHNNPDLVNARTIMRRDIERSGQPGEEINVREVAEAYEWICQLCMELIDPNLRHRQWDCEPMGLSLDHIVPIARGGCHVRANVQPAHLLCNVQKQNRLGGE